MKENKSLKRATDSLITALMGAVGFLMVFFHISNGETNIVNAGFSMPYTFIPLVLIILGMITLGRSCGAAGMLKNIWPAFLYAVLRIASGAVNGLLSDRKYWAMLCLEVFLLTGINAATVNSTTVRILVCELIAFDLIAMSICTYHFLYMNERTVNALAGFPTQSPALLPFTLVFVNPNLAGMLTGICASVCILIFSNSSRTLKLMLAPVIAANVIFMIWSNCRSAITGIVIIVILCIARRCKESIRWNRLLAGVLLVCVSVLIPVYVMTLVSETGTELQNTEQESAIDETLSGRYNLWKEHILSQEGHYLLGFGTPSKAVTTRTEYMEEANKDDTIEVDEEHQASINRSDLGVHNGYLELILSAGLPAAALLIGWLLFRLLKMDNRFIDRHPVVLLLAMLFWICVNEARFITSSVRYIAFIMMVLISWTEGSDEKETV